MRKLYEGNPQPPHVGALDRSHCQRPLLRESTGRSGVIEHFHKSDRGSLGLFSLIVSVGRFSGIFSPGSSRRIGLRGMGARIRGPPPVATTGGTLRSGFFERLMRHRPDATSLAGAM